VLIASASACGFKYLADAATQTPQAWRRTCGEVRGDRVGGRVALHLVGSQPSCYGLATGATSDGQFHPGHSQRTGVS
jgi:hypothetical protein